MMTGGQSGGRGWITTLGGKNDDGGPKPMIGVQSDGGQVLNDDGRAKRQQGVYNDDWGPRTTMGGV
jgi:hypothetical protein